MTTISGEIKIIFDKFIKVKIIDIDYEADRSLVSIQDHYTIHVNIHTNGLNMIKAVDNSDGVIK
ncbi:hypothetical protein DERP_001892 [Dermatophagoides pteronyssinus]|uniref:Uncharacterized protein n=1 Tax=Dermatophagoides pteronyssinus TaxID=6956 RepID=A0ABQ8JBX8_DERPT|nr:hypothetical protein DERP_001892 [Dermatophagoides pteronyssinus]